MKLSTFRQRWYGITMTIVALGLACLVVSLLRPLPAKALTTVDVPAFIFAPVTVSNNHTARLCINHILGEGSVTTTLEFRDAADVNRLLATTTVEVDSQKGACFGQDAASLIGSSGSARVVGIIRTTTLRNWRSTNPPVVSLQVQGAVANFIMAPALAGPSFTLPEAQ